MSGQLDALTTLPSGKAEPVWALWGREKLLSMPGIEL
jgi:hypothetical protein